MSISDKILAFILTSGIIGITSFIVFVGKYQNLIADYNERDADTGGIFLMLWIFFGAIFAGIMSFSKIFSVFSKRIKNVYKSLIISVFVSLIIGFTINALGLLAAVGLAEIARTTL